MAKYLIEYQFLFFEIPSFPLSKTFAKAEWATISSRNLRDIKITTLEMAGVKLCLIQAPVRLNFSLWRPNPEIHHYWWFVRKGMFFVLTKNSWFSCLLLVKWREFWDKLVKQINKGMIKKYFPHPPPWNVWSDLMAFSNHIMLKSRKNIFSLLLQCIFI